MQISTELKKWLSDNKLSIYELMSLAFVPKRTMEDILQKKTKYIPPLFRLYLVTGLNEFSLTKEEEIHYGKTKNPDIKNDEMIARMFIKKWKSGAGLPEEEYRLGTNKKPKPDKRNLAAKIMRELFEANNRHEKFTPKPGLFIFSEAADEIAKILGGSEQDLKKFKITNENSLRRLSSTLNCLFSEDPRAAFKTLNESKKMLS